MSGEIRVGFTESGCFHPAVTKILLEFRKTYPIRRGRLDGREIMEMRITEIADRTHRLSNYVAEIASPAGLTYNQFLAFVTLVDPRNSSCAGRCQVLWDERRQTLFAARDRFGVKPLFYATHDGKVWLASEAKALFAAGVPAQWDEEAVFQGLFAYQDLPSSLRAIA